MDGDRILRALARIEAAADRIEAAAGGAHAAARTGSRPDNSYLAAKYQTLRNEVGAALADLDRLIGTFER